MVAEEADHTDAHEGMAVGLLLKLIACSQTQVVEQQHAHTGHERQRGAAVMLIQYGAIAVDTRRFTLLAVVIPANANTGSDKSLATTSQALVVIKGCHEITGNKADLVLFVARDSADRLEISVQKFVIKINAVLAWQSIDTKKQSDVKRRLPDAVAPTEVKVKAHFVAIELWQLVLQETTAVTKLEAPSLPLARLHVFLSRCHQRQQ